MNQVIQNQCDQRTADSDFELLRTIDRVCRQAEVRLRAGETVRIEEYLDTVPAADRPAVLRELALTEWEFYTTTGRFPDKGEYQERFPEDLEVLRQVFEDLAARPADGLEKDSARSSDPPVRLGDYRIVREIGRGGMGIVYEAEQESLGRHVALKVLSSLAQIDERLVRRFAQEAQIIARLQHRHIVAIHESGEHHGTRYIAMELVRGVPLNQLWKGDSKPTDLLPEIWPALKDVSDRTRFRHIAALGSGAARALQYAHEHGVTHRDVKPSNLLLDVDGCIRLTDFGLARISGQDSSLTLTGELTGTLRYAAPENFEGTFDARSDVYSLGVTLWEVLALEPAFAAESQPVLIEKIHRGLAAADIGRMSSAPADLLTIVRKAMATHPADRYASAAELADDLDRFLRDEPIRARPVSLPERLVRWCRREPAIAGLAGTVGLILIVALVATTVLWRQALSAQAEMETERNRANAASEVARFRADVARQAQQAAETSRAAAEANLTLAWQAAQTAVERIAWHPKLAQGDFHELRRDLLGATVPLLEVIAARGADDPRLQSDTARALGGLSYVRWEIGDLAGALDACQQSKAMFEKLAADHPEITAYREHLANACANLAAILSTLQRDLEGIPYVEAAIQIRKALFEQVPENLDNGLQLIASYSTLMRILRNAQQVDKATSVCRQGLAVAAECQRRFPNDVAVRCESAGLGVSAGMIALDQGKLDEAFELAGTNVDVLAAILVELPEDRETRGRLLIGRGLLAEVFAQQNRWVEAEAEIHRMLELEASLAGDFSAIVRYRSLPTGIYAQLAGTAARAGRVETAQLLRRAAIRAGEALVGRFPEELCQTTTLGGEYVNLGLQLTGLEQRDEALSCFDRAVELLDQTHAKRPEDPKATLFCRNAHGARATCLESLRRFAEAAADWEAAAQLGDASFRHMAEENRIRCLEAAKGIAEEHALPEKH